MTLDTYNMPDPTCAGYVTAAFEVAISKRIPHAKTNLSANLTTKSTALIEDYRNRFVLKQLEPKLMVQIL